MDTTEQMQSVNRVALPVEPPDRVLVLPWGLVESKKGDFYVDSESAAAIVAAFSRHSVDLPIDLEHATLGGKYASPSGAAPAMAWIRSLDVEEGVGIYANVEWTTIGAENVRIKGYRYVSPVVLIRKSDLRVRELHSVALTNKPAIVAMEPIVNSDSGADPQLDGPIALSAAATWDAEPTLQALCGREAFIEDAIREAESHSSAHAAHRPLVSTATPDRGAIVAAAVREWDTEPELRKLVACKEGYVDGLLLAAGLCGLTTGERQSLGSQQQGERQAVINRANAGYEGESLLQSLCGREAFVEDQLRQAGMSAELTTGDRQLLVCIAHRV